MSWIILIVITAACLLASVCSITASVQSGASSFLTMLESEPEDTAVIDSDVPEALTNTDSGSDLGTLVVFVKNIIKSIILELGGQLCNFLKSLFHQYKVKLLKKLGTYTLSNIFHYVFDGVTDFVESDGLSYNSQVGQSGYSSPSYLNTKL